MKIRVENVRGSYLYLHEPQEPMAGSDSEPKYSGHFLLQPDSRVVALNADKTTKVTTIDAVLKTVAEEQWKAKGPTIMTAIEESKRCYRDGDNKLDANGDPQDGYADTFYIVAKNARQPKLKNQAKVDLTSTRDILNLMYSGAYYDVVVDLKATDKPTRCTYAKLLGVQFRKDGDAFGGGAPAGDDDFSEIAEDDASDLT